MLPSVGVGIFINPDTNPFGRWTKGARHVRFDARRKHHTIPMAGMVVSKRRMCGHTCSPRVGGTAWRETRTPWSARPPDRFRGWENKAFRFLGNGGGS